MGPANSNAQPGNVKLSDLSGDALALCPAAVMSVDLETNEGADTAALESAFGPTPAETKPALSLEEGMTLKKAVADLLVSHETVGTQLLSIFDKTSVHGEPQLVALLGRLTKPVR